MSGILRFWRKRSAAKPEVAGRPSSILILGAADSPRFGSIRSGRFELSLDGELARECWLAMPSAFPSLKLDVFAFLPHEFRAILHDTSRAEQVDSAVVWFMHQSEEQIRTLRGQGIRRVWQAPSIRFLGDEGELQLERMQILLRAKI